MLCENVTVTTAELTSGSGIIKNITSTSIPRAVATRDTGPLRDINYYVKSVEFTNDTGDTVHVLPMTLADYRGWASDNTITSLIAVADSASKEITSLKGRIEYILCSGVAAGSHASDLTITVIKEY